MSSSPEPSVLVLVTHGGTDPYRERARELVLQHYGLNFPEWRGHLTTSDVVPFPKAHLLNEAVRNLAGETDVLVLNDADSLVDPLQVREAVALAATAPGLVFAFDTYCRLSKGSSGQVSSFMDCRYQELEAVFRESGSHGCVAIRKACWDELGGLDEAYGWMHEDLDFDNRAAALWPLRRVRGPLFHLWHPRDPVLEARNVERYRLQWGTA